MNRRQAVGLGVIAILLAIIGTAAWAIGLVSVPWALAYVVAVGATVPVLVYGYCGKCPALDECSHIVPGLLARVLPRRTPGPYTAADYTATGLVLALWLVAPLPWLETRPWLLVVFLSLIGSAAALMTRIVCPGCANVNCPVCPRRTGRRDAA